MSSLPVPGFLSRHVDTDRLRTHVLSSGDPDGRPVLFIHGNMSSGRFWGRTMLALPALSTFAPDLRGFGESEGKPIDARRGVRDFADDLFALVSAVGLTDRKIHLVGWSVGGAVAMQYAIDHADLVASITLSATMSPFGFGGTRDAAGRPCSDDWAGTGGGTASAEMVQRLRSGDAGEDSPFSPRSVMRQFYFKAPFKLSASLEDAFVTEILKMSLGDDHYPGDLATVTSWPGVGPGDRGVNNAISGKHCNVSAFAHISPKPEVLWVRGADDQVVSDTSMFDLGYLGQLGAVPGWPGAEAFPPQPMLAQTRAVLEAYAAGGGRFREYVLADCGHSPHLEQPERFQRVVGDFIAAQ